MQSITNLAKDGKDKLIYPIQIIRLATEKQFRKKGRKVRNNKTNNVDSTEKHNCKIQEILCQKTKIAKEMTLLHSKLVQENTSNRKLKKPELY